MNTCWKCGREIPEGQTECSDCAEGVSPAVMSDEEMDKHEADFKREYMEVDWDKIKTLQDLVGVLSNSDIPLYVWKESPGFARVKKFLKPIE